MNQMIGDRPTLLRSNSQISDDLSLLEIIDLITDTLGIHIQPQHQDGLKKIVLKRIKALELSSLNDYHEYLIVQRRILSGATEWQWLISFLSVTESYFFRDQGQFWLLKNRVLPELIERKRQFHLLHSAHGQRPILRLWSAGCSTGEEAYSLAILLKELIPDYQEWDILILGTDINQPAIELARQGIYSDWSFRATDPEIKNRYFRAHRKDWKIAPDIREIVTFQPGNLVQDRYPAFASKIHALDLILCRNVFIYFDFKAIALVLDKFYRSLASGGVLLTGHTELHGQKTEIFKAKIFPQSVIYQKDICQFSKLKTSSLCPPLEPNKTSIAVFHSPLPNEGLIVRTNHTLGAQPTVQQSLLREAQRLLTQEAYSDAIQKAEQLLALVPQHFQAYCLSAEASANLGQYSQATQACQQALRIDPLAIKPYYLLAQIAEEQGDIDNAKIYLKRIIYLTPTSVPAYLELSSIYEWEGNSKQAQKTWLSLLEVLKNLPQEQAINSSNQQTIAELKEYILQQLGMEMK